MLKLLFKRSLNVRVNEVISERKGIKTVIKPLNDKLVDIKKPIKSAEEVINDENV